MQEDELVTLERGAELLGIPVAGVRKAAERGRFPVKRFGKRGVLVQLSVLRAWAADPSKHRPGRPKKLPY